MTWWRSATRSYRSASVTISVTVVPGSNPTSVGFVTLPQICHLVDNCSKLSGVGIDRWSGFDHRSNPADDGFDRWSPIKTGWRRIWSMVRIWPPINSRCLWKWTNLMIFGVNSKTSEAGIDRWQDTRRRVIPLNFFRYRSMEIKRGWNPDKNKASGRIWTIDLSLTKRMLYP